jgi:hypothetical protein
MIIQIPRKIRGELRDLIKEHVAAGFDAPADIVTWVVALYSDRFPPESLQPVVENMVTKTVARHLAAQSYWPEVTDCDRLDHAFAELEQNGILCRQNYEDCLTCGHAALRDEAELAREEGRDVRGYTFFHAQDITWVLDGDLYLAFGLPPATAEEFEEIILALLPRCLDNDDASAARTVPADPGQPVRLKRHIIEALRKLDPAAALPTTVGETLQAIRRVLTTLPLLECMATMDAVPARRTALSTVACEVVMTLQRHGIDAMWSGQPHDRIEGRLHWQRRRP